MQDARPPVPVYRKALFWGVLGALIALLLFWLVWRFLQNTPVAEAPQFDSAELLALQEQQTGSLKEEIARLKQLLAQDPCDIEKEWLGAVRKLPVAPSYAPPPAVSPSGPTQQGSGQLGSGPEGTAQNGGTPTPPVPSAGASTLPAPAEQPASVGELMEKATVFIMSPADKGLSTGSGFFVAPDIIATNRHVIENAASSSVWVGNKAIGTMKKAQIIAVSKEPDKDFALLRLNEPLERPVPSLQLASSVKRATRISAWGYPGYISSIDPKLKALVEGDSNSVPEVVYSEGTVSVILDRTPPMLLHSAGLSQGNSGGPLVNMHGVVVGINTFIRQAEQSYSQANIALLSTDLAQFIQNSGITPTVVAEPQTP